MTIKHIYLCIFVVIIFIIPATGFSSSLTLKIDSPTKTYKQNNQFELSVTFYNTSNNPFIVFPAYIKRKYIPLDGQKAIFKPYPGPVVDPWPGAIIIRGRGNNTAMFKGMRNGDGIWNLEPGRYELSVNLFVATTSSFGTTPTLFSDIEIWRGKVESNSISINYLADQ